MTAPSTPSYQKLRFDRIVGAEGKTSAAIYLDASGYPTIGYGFLVSAQARSIKANSPDPDLTQQVIDTLNEAGRSRTELEKHFVFEGKRLVGLKEPQADGSVRVTDISELLPAKQSMAVFNSIAGKYEAGVDEALDTAGLAGNVTESQRAALFSRIYNTGANPNAIAGAKALSGDDPAAVVDFFTYGRGSHGNNGHYNRAIEEAQQFLGDSVTPASKGAAKGFSYVAQDGNDIFIGWQPAPKQANGDSRQIVAYKVVENDDGTLRQEPLSTNVGRGHHLNNAPASALPTDPDVALHNAVLIGDPIEVLKAIALQPDVTTPAKALQEFHDYAYDAGELQDINIGSNSKPVWGKGYVLAGENDKTIVVGYTENGRGRGANAALFAYEVDAPTDTNPSPEPRHTEIALGKGSSKVSVASSATPNADGQAGTPSASSTFSPFKTAAVEGYLDHANGTSYIEYKQPSGGLEAGAKEWEWDKGNQRLVVHPDGKAEHYTFDAAGGDWILQSPSSSIDTAWSIPQADGGSIRYEVNPDGDWRLTRTDAASRVADVTESIDGGWIRTDGSGRVLDGYANGEPLPRSDLTASDSPAMPSAGGGFSAVPYTLPDGSQGMAFVGPNRPAIIVGEDGRRFEVDADGNVTWLFDTDGGKIIRASYQPHADTAIDGDVTSGEKPGESTPKTDEAAPVTPDYGFSALNSATDLVLAIQHGNDLGAVISGVNLANDIARSAGGEAFIPGAVGTGLGAASSLLNLSDALDRGDTGAIIVSGTNLASQGASLWSSYLANESAQLVASGAATEGAALLAQSQAAGSVAQTLGQAAAVLGIAYSLANGDYTGAAIGVVTYCVPVIGWVLAFAAAGGMFDDEPDTPTSYGDASASWNDAGDIKIATTRDEADGGATATAWMNNLLGGLREELASRTDASGQPLYGLDPARLPGIGYAFDPDTQAGYLRLSWTEPDGTLQWRQYDTSGRRDGSNLEGTNDLVRDFFLHAADAIVPAWEARTLFQQGTDGGRRTVFTGELSADGATTTRTVLTLGSAATSTNARLDIDGDGYLEATQWTASPMLAIDLDGDGRITAADLVDGRDGSDGSQARNGLVALDANGDGIVDARDPAFAALRLWRDANGDGIAEAGELGSLADAGVERIDASTLARQTLAGDTRGTAQAMTADGLYQFQEGGETTLLALNQHAFDHDPAHAHGGEANPDAHGEMLVDVGAANMQSTGNARPTTVRTHVQGDAALRDAGPGIVLRGQAPGRTMGDERTLEPLTTATATETEGEGPGARAAAPDAIRIEAGDARVTSNPPNPRPPSPPRTHNPIGPIGPIAPFAFVPGTAASPGRAVREVTRDMIASADSGLFGGGGGVGVAPLAALAVSALPLAFPELAAAAHLEEPSTAPPSRAPASMLTEDRLRGVLDSSLPASTSPAPHVAGHAAGVEPAPLAESPSAAPMAAPSPMVFANSAPIATGESAATDEDRTILVAPGGLLANDRDIDGPDGHKAPAGFPTRPSAYAHRHIACRRARPYNSTLSAKTRDQAGGGQPMTVQRTARARSFQGAMN